MYEFHERDWKLFRKKVPDWQENFMARLCDEYVDLLRADALPSTRFWQLEKRIRNDQRKTGVLVDMRRSMMYTDIDNLLREGAITLEDLDGFSDDLRNTFAGWHGRGSGPSDVATAPPPSCGPSAP